MSGLVVSMDFTVEFSADCDALPNGRRPLRTVASAWRDEDRARCQVLLVMSDPHSGVDYVEYRSDAGPDRTDCLPMTEFPDDLNATVGAATGVDLKGWTGR